MDMEKAVNDYLSVSDKVTDIGNRSGLSDDALMDMQIQLQFKYMEEMGYSDDDVIAIEEYMCSE